MKKFDLNIMKRPIYTAGESLEQSDFANQQAYFLNTSRYRDRGLLTPGVLTGLEVVDRGQKGLRVSPGVAVDDLGRLICLNAWAWVPTVSLEPGLYYLTISFAEQLTARSDESGISGYKRMDETPDLRFRTQLANPDRDILLAIFSHSGDVVGDRIQRYVGNEKRKHSGVRVGSIHFNTDTQQRDPAIYLDPNGYDLEMVAPVTTFQEQLFTQSWLQVGPDYAGALTVTAAQYRGVFPIQVDGTKVSGVSEKPFPAFTQGDILIVANNNGTESRATVVESNDNGATVSPSLGPLGLITDYQVLPAVTAAFDLQEQQYRIPLMRILDEGRLSFGTTQRNVYSSVGEVISVPEQVLFIDKTGQVGIGTSKPQYELEVDGVVHATSFVGSGSGLVGVTGLWSQTPKPAQQVTQNSSSQEPIRKDIYYDHGDVGIGVDQADSRLYVVGYKEVRVSGVISTKPPAKGASSAQVQATARTVFGWQTLFTQQIQVEDSILVGNLPNDEGVIKPQIVTVVKIISDTKVLVSPGFSSPLTDSVFHVLRPLALFYRENNPVPALAVMPGLTVGVNTATPEYSQDGSATLDINGTLALRSLTVDTLECETMMVTDWMKLGDHISAFASSGQLNTKQLKVSNTIHVNNPYDKGTGTVSGNPSTAAETTLDGSTGKVTTPTLTASETQVATALSTPISITKAGTNTAVLEISDSLKVGDHVAMAAGDIKLNHLSGNTLTLGTQTSDQTTIDAQGNVTSNTVKGSNTSQTDGSLSITKATLLTMNQMHGWAKGHWYTANTDGYLTGGGICSVSLGKLVNGHIEIITTFDIFYFYLTVEKHSHGALFWKHYSYTNTPHYTERMLTVAVPAGLMFCMSDSGYGFNVDDVRWVSSGSKNTDPSLGAQANIPSPSQNTDYTVVLKAAINNTFTDLSNALNNEISSLQALLQPAIDLVSDKARVAADKTMKKAAKQAYMQAWPGKFSNAIASISKKFNSNVSGQLKLQVTKNLNSLFIAANGLPTLTQTQIKKILSSLQSGLVSKDENPPLTADASMGDLLTLVATTKLNSIFDAIKSGTNDASVLETMLQAGIGELVSTGQHLSTGSPSNYNANINQVAYAIFSNVGHITNFSS